MARKDKKVDQQVAFEQKLNNFQTKGFSKKDKTQKQTPFPL